MVDCHKCDICNKIYSSYKSLWKHTKNIHKNNTLNILETSRNVVETSHNIKIYNCRYCNKIYNNNKSRWGHEQKCKLIFDEKEQEKQINEIKIAEINKEIKLAEIKLAEINLELKKVEIKKENSIIKRKTNSNPTIKNINKLLQN